MGVLQGKHAGAKVTYYSKNLTQTEDKEQQPQTGSRLWQQRPAPSGRYAFHAEKR